MATLGMDPWNLTNSSLECDQLIGDSSKKDGRIPEVLAINIGLWLILFAVFLIIWFSASNYSRVGMVTSKKWVKAVYKRTSGGLLESKATLMPADEDEKFSWIKHFLLLSDEDILRCCGPDASIFLSLERHIIVLLCIFSFLSIVIILPINYLSGDLEEGRGFPRTTISNVPANSSALWAHTLFSLLYLCITVVFMIHFSLRLGKHQDRTSDYTMMIQCIPKYVHREDVMQHFQEALPHSQVADMQLAHDVSRLTKLSNDLCNVNNELESVESMSVEMGENVMIRVGWRKICIFSDSYLVDAKTYYLGRQQELTQAIEFEKTTIADKRLGIGFVTFSRKNEANEFLTSYKLCRRHPKSSLYETIRARWWWVSMAPFPDDIIWENLPSSSLLWVIRWILFNSVLFVFLFFFTTPSILLSSIEYVKATVISDEQEDETVKSFGVDPLVKDYVSSLLLLLFALLMPYVVAKSCYLEGYWTKSYREQNIMRKTYIFMLLMLIVLPSIGMVSLNAAGELAFRGEEGVRARLQCVYLPNHGVFFISYIIAASFLGTITELLRVPQLIRYMYRTLRAKTSLQREQALKKASQYDFMYGLQYARNLVVFTMVVVFSLTTPIIVPFGVIYFIMNYFTDKFNIYYVYRPASFNGRQFLHRNAMHFVIVGVVGLQLSTLFFSVIRLGEVDPRTVFLLVVFILTCVVCVGFMMFGWFSHLLPHLRIKLGKENQVFGFTRGEAREQKEGHPLKGAYIPPVLKQQSGDPLCDNSVNGYESFGSTDRVSRQSPPSSKSPVDSPLKRGNVDDVEDCTSETQGLV